MASVSGSQRIIAVTVLFAVALMIAVPVMTAAGTDAAIDKAEAGYCIDLTDPTDEQLDDVKVSKNKTLLNTLWGQDGIFDDDVVSTTLIILESYIYSQAAGEKISSDETEKIMSSAVTGNGFKMTYNVKADGKLALTNFPSTKLNAACKAINDYFGPVQTGDRIEIAGNLKEEYAAVEVTEYLLQDDGTCVPVKVRESGYTLAGSDVTIKLIRGDAEFKSVRYVSDIKGTITQEATVTYNESPVKVGTEYTKSYKTTTSYGGDMCFKINGADYSIADYEESKPTEHGTVTHVDAQSEIVISSSLKEYIDDLPGSEEGMKVEKGYGAAQSAVDGVISDVSGKNGPVPPGINGTVIILILVLIVALVIVLVVFLKKRNQ